jgi:hypothetical protein
MAFSRFYTYKTPKNRGLNIENQAARMVCCFQAHEFIPREPGFALEKTPESGLHFLPIS